MTDRPLDVLCLGEAMVEFNQRKGEADPLYLQGFGGDTSNACIAAARQGARAGYMTALGVDAFGDMIVDLWRREGVDTTHVRRDASAHTGIYFVTHGPDGHAFSYMRAGSAASRFGPEAVTRDAVASAKILHVSGISQAISPQACDAVFAAIAHAKAAGTMVSYDTNLRLKLWPLDRAKATLAAATAKADVVLPSIDDAATMIGSDDPDTVADHYLGLHTKIVAVKLGAAGVLVATRYARERIPPMKVEAIDATGAGDTCAGAFLARLAAGDDPFAAGRWANAAAALATTGWGAVAPMPTKAQVAAALGV
ncbi:MAG: sugar kinase [Rhodospirillales bacterium]